MFRRILLCGWAVYFGGALLLLLFPRELARHLSLAILLVLSLLLVTATVAYAFRLLYIRRLKRR